jgi:hypothetical protein
MKGITPERRAKRKLPRGGQLAEKRPSVPSSSGAAPTTFNRWVGDLTHMWIASGLPTIRPQGPHKH